MLQSRAARLSGAVTTLSATAAGHLRQQCATVGSAAALLFDKTGDPSNVLHLNQVHLPELSETGIHVQVLLVR